MSNLSLDSATINLGRSRPTLLRKAKCRRPNSPHYHSQLDNTCPDNY